MSAKEHALRVRDLTIGYKGRLVLKDLNFHVERGEVFVILGGSGCGKSTLLKHLIGLHAPIRGEVWFGEENLVGAPMAVRRRLLQKFGVMYQSGALFGSMTVLQNVRLPLDAFTDLPVELKELVAFSKLQMVGLAASGHKMPSELSGGMQKRAAIARAMALDPGILFLDEPSAGLDPVTSAGLDALILELAQTLKVTFVIVTHELQSIYAIANRVIMLDSRTKGIIAEGTPDHLRDHAEDPWVRRFFNRQPDVSSS